MMDTVTAAGPRPDWHPVITAGLHREPVTTVRQRIGIVKLSAFGDVVHALPVARALRRAFPGAHVSWMVEARESGILQGHPDLDAVIPVDSRRWRRLIGQPRGAREALGELDGLRARLRAARLDVALDLQGLIKSGVLIALTRAPVRIGFSRARCRESLSALFTNRHITPPPTAVHVVEQYLALLEPLGITGVRPDFYVPMDPAADRRADEFTRAHGIARGTRLVALNPGAARESKRWPAVHFRAVAERLASEADARVLLLWGPDEAPLAREIASGLSAPPLLAPPTDLRELASLLRRCALMISGDTGPLHLAAAVGTPCLGLFGPTRAERNGPYGARCRALQSGDGTMAALEPGPVVAAARALLGADR
jgi:lipopolysaccharide heptosyltransferase I